MCRSTFIELCILSWMEPDSDIVNSGLAEIDHDRALAEPASLDGAVDESCHKPYSTHNFGGHSKSQPYPQTKHESAERHHNVSNPSTLAARLLHEGELREGGQVHPHEGEKCAKIQDLAGLLVSNEQGPDIRHNSDQPDVPGGGITLGIKVSKKLPWQNIVATHAEEQAGSPHLTRQPRSNRSQNQNDAQSLEKQRPSHPPRNIHKGCFSTGEGPEIRPHSLSEVDFQAPNDTGEQAN